MSKILIFMLGFIIGGIIMTILMCFLQINHINQLEENSIKR